MSLVAEPYLAAAEWSQVRHLPPDFAAYAAEPLVQLAAESPGKTAFLQLHFQRRGDRTCLARNYSAGHQIVRQVHYLDPVLDDMAVVFLQANSAGVLQGDRLRIEIRVDEGARAVVTTQAATKVFEMTANYASQRIDISVGRDAYLELMMDPLILHKGSRYYNEVNVDIDPSGVLVYDEHLTPGRVAHGESWQFDHLFSRLRCTRPDGELVVADTNVLTPQQRSVTTPGLFGSSSDMGVMYVLAEQHDDHAALADAMHDSVDGLDDIVGSASVLPGGTGAHARVVGASTSRTGGALHACWQAVRRALLDVDVTPIYRAKHSFDPSASRTVADTPEGPTR